MGNDGSIGAFMRCFAGCDVCWGDLAILIQQVIKHISCCDVKIAGVLVAEFTEICVIDSINDLRLERVIHAMMIIIMRLSSVCCALADSRAATVPTLSIKGPGS